jgi:hypothetical protein
MEKRASGEEEGESDNEREGVRFKVRGDGES